LINTPVTPLTPAAMFTKPARANTLTTPKISEEDTITITVEETVERELVVMDTRSMAIIMELATAMAREEVKVKREGDRGIERVGSGEFRLWRGRWYGGEKDGTRA
jgi:hypothetical protein